MAALDENSTFPQVMAVRANNSNYLATRSITETEDYIHAQRMFINMLPSNSTHQTGDQLAFDLNVARQMLIDAERFLEILKPVASGEVLPDVIHPDFRDYR